MSLVHSHIRLGGSTEDKALFDPNLSTAVTPGVNFSEAGTATLPTRSDGPQLLELVASHGGNVVFGLDRGRNNLSNSISAAIAAKAHLSNLYASELGNEPELFAYLDFPIAPSSSTWTAVAGLHRNPNGRQPSEPPWAKSTSLEAGNFYESPAFGYSAQALLSSALEEATGLKCIRTFSHHTYPQSVAAGPTPSQPSPADVPRQHLHEGRAVRGGCGLRQLPRSRIYLWPNERCIWRWIGHHKSRVRNRTVGPGLRSTVREQRDRSGTLVLPPRRDRRGELRVVDHSRCPGPVLRRLCGGGRSRRRELRHCTG